MVDFLNSLAALMWPAMVLYIVIRFEPAIRRLVESARSRKFTVKIGGQELSMEEATAQQNKVVSDILATLADLRDQLETTSETPVKAAAEPITMPRVLWVDDQPRNNSYFLDALEREGVRIDLAYTTEEAIAYLGSKSYSAIVTDVGRREDGHYRATAGLELLEVIRQEEEPIPVAVFSSARAAEKYSKAALDLGARVVTSSGVDLMRFFHRHVIR